MGVLTTESAMCIASGYVFGRFTAATCLIPTSVSPKLPPPSSVRSFQITFLSFIFLIIVLLSKIYGSFRIWDRRYRDVVRVRWRTWWEDVGMRIRISGRRWRKRWRCWRLSILQRAEEWFLPISNKAVSVSGDTEAHDMLWYDIQTHVSSRDLFNFSLFWK